MIRKKIVAALFFFCALFLLGSPTKASQGNLVLPTTGLVSGPQFSALVTAAIAALNTCNSGTTAPANATGGAPATGQCWDDTSSTPTLRKLFDGAVWIVVGAIDTTNNIWMPPIGGGVVSLASAATTDVCSVRHSYVNITGSTGITSFGGTGCPVGQVKILKFAAAPLITHNASTLALPGVANIQAAAGDMAIAVKASATKWEVVNYMVAASVPGGGGGGGGGSVSVPVGTMLDYVGFVAPSGFEFCGSQTISRTTYPDYLAAVTLAKTVTRTSGNVILTSVAGGTEGIAVGAGIEGTGINAFATVVSKTSSTVTMSQAATSAGTGTVTFFAVGRGNGSTTIGLPDKRGRVTAGRDDMSNNPASRLTVGSASECPGDGVGAACGNQIGTLTEAQLPVVSKTVTININVSGSTSNAGNHTHPFTDNGFGERDTFDGDGGVKEVANTNTQSDTTDSAGQHQHTFNANGSDTDTVAFGSGAAHSRVQPTLVTNCIVRVQ